jgi:ATP-dependent Clp protease protease subunit
MKKLLIVIAILIMACATQPVQFPPQEVVIKIQSIDGKEIESVGDGIQRTMGIQNTEGELSQLSFTCKASNKAFLKIFSGLSVADVTRLWNDFRWLENNTKIRDIELFINSPGGDAFAGLAIADEIERSQRKGFHITAYASGIIASAAVPVFAVCEKRIASPGTIFLTHQASLWVWPGQETASDIKAKNDLMLILQDRYINYLVRTTRLTKSEWESKINSTTWFNVEQGLEYGLIDKVN